jgi:magnesium-dependent phosphatase 1
MALASRTPTPHVAAAFLKQLDLEQYFCSVQLIPAADGFDQATAQKDTCHFPNIAKATGVSFDDMLFFDDEAKNIRLVAQLGTTAVLVDTSTGMTMDVLLQGLRLHASRKQAADS